MKSARLLVIALLLCVWRMAALAAPAISHSPNRFFRVAGYVLDAVSRRPVPGVVVFVRGASLALDINSSSTDSAGRFALRVRGTRRARLVQLMVRTVLYAGDVTVSADSSQRVTILLRRNAYRFRPDGCQLPADSARIPPYAQVPILGLPGAQYAFFIQGDSSMHGLRKLRTVSISMSPDAFPQEPIRIRIYRSNNRMEEPPGEDLLLENIMLCGENAAVRTYDVSQDDIIVPAQGFFIGLDYIVSDARCMDQVRALPNHTPTGPILRPPCARSDIRTWENVSGQGWCGATAAENCWPLYESVLSVEVEPAPAQR